MFFVYYNQKNDLQIEKYLYEIISKIELAKDEDLGYFEFYLGKGKLRFNIRNEIFEKIKNSLETEITGKVSIVEYKPFTPPPEKAKYL